MNRKRRCAVALLVILILIWVFSDHHTWDDRGEAARKHEFLGTWWQSSSFHYNDIHPTRGWTPKPNGRFGFGNGSTNNRGQRSLHDYAYHPERYNILILGDSFTYGLGVADQDIWPTVLEGLDGSFYVINLGACGYGIDQMLITLRETIEDYKPQLVILAPITEDFQRTLLSFREYKKPRFVLDGNGELVLTNTPIGSKAEMRAELRKQYGYWDATAKLKEEDKAFQERAMTPEYRKDWMDLDTKLIEATSKSARDHGADFLFVYLASCNEITRKYPDDQHVMEKFLDSVTQELRLQSLLTEEYFLKQGTNWASGHYTAKEHRFMAQIVCDKIKELDSWRKFVGPK